MIKEMEAGEIDQARPCLTFSALCAGFEFCLLVLGYCIPQETFLWESGMAEVKQVMA